jgi:uncharacterized membrane protein YhaH (DUF805 family)
VGKAIMVYTLPTREKIPVNKKLPDRRLELESVLRGISFVFICVFTLPVIVAIFVLTAAILNLGQGSSTNMPFPDSYWKSLLSFAFRISLIPGIVYLTSRGLRRLRDRGREKRLALIFASLMLFSVLIVMPPKPEERATFSGSQLKPQLTKQVIYRPESRKARAADNKNPLNGPHLERS